MAPVDGAAFGRAFLEKALRRILVLALNGMTAYWSGCAAQRRCPASP